MHLDREVIKNAVLIYLMKQGWTRCDAYEAGCEIADLLNLDESNNSIQ